MFNAPEIIMKIPEMQYIFAKNYVQQKEIEIIMEQLEKDLRMNSMGLEIILRWEKLLDIMPNVKDTIEDRRFRIKTKVMERMPYTRKNLQKKIEILFGGECRKNITANKLEIVLKLPIFSVNVKKELEEMLEEITPLNLLIRIAAENKIKLETKTYTSCVFSKCIYKEVS